jgi:hypothetical protein
VRVQRVLERVHAAVEEDGPVRLHQQRHRLVLGGAGRVAEPQRDGDEAVALRVCSDDRVCQRFEAARTKGMPDA